jgi:hypothetical protein
MQLNDSFTDKKNYIWRYNTKSITRQTDTFTFIQLAEKTEKWEIHAVVIKTLFEKPEGRTLLERHGKVKLKLLSGDNSVGSG